MKTDRPGPRQSRGESESSGPGSAENFAASESVADMSTRAAILARRTYNRLKDDGTYESWSETIDRTIRHQAWLWARARGQIQRSAANAETVFQDPTLDAVGDAGFGEVHVG